MARHRIALTIVTLACLRPAWAQEPGKAAKADPAAESQATAPDPNSPDEYLQGIRDHLTLVRTQMVDTAFPLARREAIAAETLAYLRSQVAEAPDPDDALEVWSLLIGLALEFSEIHPMHPMSDRFLLTRAEGWWQRSRLIGRIDRASASAATNDPGRTDRDKARELLEGMVKANGPANDQYSQTARYMLAQCFADMLLVDPKMDDAEAKALRERILELTQRMDSEALADWARLMRARALAELGRTEEARAETDAVTEAFRHRYAAPWAEAKTIVLTKSRQWQEADDFLKDTDLPIATAARLKMSVWTDRAALPMTEAEKAAVTDAAFEAADLATQREDQESDTALRQLSRSGIVPGDDASAGRWSLMAIAHMKAGRVDAAAEALDHASEKEADAKRRVGHVYQAGAAWLQAGRPNLAQQRMRAALESPAIGDLGPKAGLIRVMAINRMGAAGLPLLDEAIATHLARFGEDLLTADEVRWIEGETAMAAGDRDRAMRAWEAIRPKHPRWMPAQMAMFRASLDRLEELVLIADTKTFAVEWDQSRKRLERARDSGLPAEDKATIELAIARMDLTPGADRFDAARQAVARLLPKLTRDNQRQWAQALLILADAQLGRKLDLRERLSGRDKSMDVSLIIDMCRVLDTSAFIIDSEATRRSLGAAMASVAESLPPASPAFSEEINQELELRKIRGLIYAGQPSAAEPRLDAWLTANPDVKPVLLYGVADALLRLNATDKAISYLSQWVTQAQEGSPQWFLGRLELAKALYRESHDKQARQIIDATLLLYPDAGGPGMKRKFEQFKRTLGKS